MADKQVAKASNWRIILAFFLDFFTAFFVIGFVIASLTGALTSNGFQLSGLPALLAFALIIAYFFVGNRTGGTLWKRILKVPVK